LKEWGFEIIHKPHPETLTPSPHVFYTDLGAVPAGGDFVDAVQSADRILLIQDTGTTTLRIALESGKPVTIIDLERLPWNEAARKLLARRSAIVEGSLEESNRVQIDWAMLREALDRSLELNDHGFQTTFLQY
jgi:hypothetical protein